MEVAVNHVASNALLLGDLQVTAVAREGVEQPVQRNEGAAAEANDVEDVQSEPGDLGREASELGLASVSYTHL